MQMARVPILDSQYRDDEDDANEGEKRDDGLIKGNAGTLVSESGSMSAEDLQNTKLVTTSRVVVSVTEGKYRMVRRVLHNAGHSVLQLHRVRYGSLFLKDLEAGEVRPCNPEEKQWAENLAKTVSAARQQAVSAAKIEARATQSGLLS
jgi:16S rRNA U516 pseudouridylate synthase RsuA-like enzyme